MISYNRLWKLLIDRNIKKGELCQIAGVSPASITKMGRNGYMSTEVIDKICIALECKIEDIMEVVVEEQ